MRCEACSGLLAALSLIALPSLAIVNPSPGDKPTGSATPSADALEIIRHRGDLHAQRRFGWEAFAQILSPRDGARSPALESWYGEEAVFAAGVGERTGRGVRGFSRADAPGAASHGPPSADAPFLSYTLYNGAAYRHIRDHRLYSSTELARLQRTAAADRSIPGSRSIPDFPADAAVLKTAWWPVAHDRLTGMPVWNQASNPARRGGNDYTSWKQVVAVDPGQKRATGNTATIQFAGRTIPQAQRINLSDLYHVTVDASLAKRLALDSSANKAALVVLGRPFEAGDSLALVGANLATKQIRDWVWATIWWNDHVGDTEFAANRPAALEHQWRHYLLQVAFDSTKPTAADGGPHVCFNPWLEGRFPDGGMGGGTVSNCQSCHRRASYPAVAFLPVTRGAPDLKNDPAYRPGQLRTNFIWAIAMHAVPQSPSVSGQ